MSWIEDIWHLFLPRICPMCGNVLSPNEEHLCSHCLQHLPRTEEGAHRDNRMEQVLCDQKKLVRAAAFCFYNDDFRRAVHHIKFYGHPEAGAFLGEMAAKEWKDNGFFDDIDLIIPLPLHRSRLHSRGFNQAEWIARGISQATGIPVDTKHLIRKKNNVHQSLLKKEERKQESDTFAILQPDELRGKHVLLVDDVLTTGNTIKSALSHFQSIRYCTYSVFTLALAHS